MILFHSFAIVKPHFRKFNTLSGELPVEIEISEHEKGIIFSSFKQAEKHFTTINKTNGHGYVGCFNSSEMGYWIRGGENLSLSIHRGAFDSEDFEEIVGFWKIPNEICKGQKYYVSGRETLKKFQKSYSEIFESNNGYSKEVCVFVGADSYEGLTLYGNADGKTTIFESDGEKSECIGKDCIYQSSGKSFFVRFEFNDGIFKLKNGPLQTVLKAMVNLKKSPALFKEEHEELLREIKLGDPIHHEPVMLGGLIIIPILIVVIAFITTFCYIIRACFFSIFKVDICPCCKCCMCLELGNRNEADEEEVEGIPSDVNYTNGAYPDKQCPFPPGQPYPIQPEQYQAGEPFQQQPQKAEQVYEPPVPPPAYLSAQAPTGPGCEDNPYSSV